jgi:hypothetical protein
LSRLRIDVVTTSAHFDADPETVWKTMLSYEEVPGRPSLILRILLPNPIRTQGDKTSVGARVLCTYKNGELVKRIVKVEAPNLLEFQVSDQHLGIERWITLGCGSYQIRPSGVQTKIALTTNYHGHLWPRFFWRPMERLLGHQFHHHILNGMRDALPLTGSVPCTTSP